LKLQGKKEKKNEIPRLWMYVRLGWVVVMRYTGVPKALPTWTVLSSVLLANSARGSVLRSCYRQNDRRGGVLSSHGHDSFLFHTVPSDPKVNTAYNLAGVEPPFPDNKALDT